MLKFILQKESIVKSVLFAILRFQFIIDYGIIYRNRVMIFRTGNQYERIWNMPASKNTKEVHNNKASKRKRVNRLKTFIVLAAVILLFTSVFLNFALVFKVLKLEGQIDQIYSQNNVIVTQNILYM